MFRDLSRQLKAIRRRPYATINGVRLPLGGLSPRMQQRLLKGKYEAAEAEIVSRHLGADERAVEFGAGLGYLTTLLARRCGSDSVTSYEANPNMVPLIEHTFRLNGVSPTLINAAVSREGSGLTLNLCDDFWSSSIHQRDQLSGSIPVPGVAFRACLEEKQPSFVLMDIEGAESTLVGESIPDVVRHMAIELHEHIIGGDSVLAVRSWLADNGFKSIVDNGNRSVLYVRRE